MTDIIKVVVIGDSGSGKTNLVNRYTDTQKFNQTYQATIGVDFRQRELEKPPIKLQIWDVGGKEHDSLLKVYYKGAIAIIITVDVTSEEGLINLRTHLDSVRKHGEKNIPVYIVATKCDATELIKISEVELKNAVTNLTEKYLDNFRIEKPIYGTSAKNDEKLADVFNLIAVNYMLRSPLKLQDDAPIFINIPQQQTKELNANFTKALEELEEEIKCEYNIRSNYLTETAREVLFAIKSAQPNATETELETLIKVAQQTKLILKATPTADQLEDYKALINTVSSQRHWGKTIAGAMICFLALVTLNLAIIAAVASFGTVPALMTISLLIGTSTLTQSLTISCAVLSFGAAIGGSFLMNQPCSKGVAHATHQFWQAASSSTSSNTKEKEMGSSFITPTSDK